MFFHALTFVGPKEAVWTQGQLAEYVLKHLPRDSASYSFISNLIPIEFAPKTLSKHKNIPFLFSKQNGAGCKHLNVTTS